MLSVTASTTFAVAVDATGKETLRALLVQTSPAAAPDGGVPALVIPPHTGPLVDAGGTIAFATPEGLVGIVAPSGTVELLGDALCSRSAQAGSRPLPPVVGLAPAGRGAFVVACSSGSIHRIHAAD
jgi:hypothetical protein